ncbi:MAG: SPOR domain-containing protein [Tannerella sp.]|nr:SPOR domain-containing protein [Tannerella sp.]
MKKILLFGTAICCVFMLGSCKSKSSAYKTAYEQAKSSDNSTWENEEAEEDETEVLTSETVSYESVKQEKVKIASGEDETGLKKYSVVIGSFKNRTNAYSLKERMIDEGYRPVVAENESGMLRVIVTSFDSKADAARSRDAIKSKYAPNFQDAWLLERRY